MNTINNTLIGHQPSFNSRKPRAKFLYANPNLMNIKDSVNLTLHKEGEVKNLKDLFKLNAVVDKIKQNPKETALIALIGTTILMAALNELNSKKEEDNAKKVPLRTRETRREKFHNRMQKDIANYASSIDQATDEKQLNVLVKNIENSFMCNYQALTDGEIKQLDALLNKINVKKKNLALGSIVAGLQNNAQKKALQETSQQKQNYSKSANNKITQNNISISEKPARESIAVSMANDLKPQSPEKTEQTKPDAVGKKKQKAVKSNKKAAINTLALKKSWDKVKGFVKEHVQEFVLGAMLLLSTLIGINKCNNKNQVENQYKPNLTVVDNDTTAIKNDTIAVKQDTLDVQPIITPISQENVTDYVVKKGDNVWNITKRQLKKDNGKNAKNSVINIETRKNVKDNNLSYEADDYRVIIQPGDTLKIRTYNQK